jgi:hypothetical protein
MGDSRIKDVSTLLSSFFNEEKRRQGERYSGFFAAWPSIVGPRLAAHSRVSDVDKGLLVIEAEHPGWIQLLQLRQSGILEDVARRYPELALRGIVFRLSGQAGAPAARPAPAEEGAEPEPPPEPDPKLEAAQASALEEIGDPGFRDLLRSLKKTMQGKAPRDY